MSILNNLIKKKYKKNLIQNYINWYAKNIKNIIKYSNFC